ncbi:MAG: sugar transporter permease, partial [Thermomicrobiales bacterium]|nr:sugar transporter permease [Thermomicrobiales bacterium]
MPAVVVIAAVIVFPWVFTVFMSLHDWQVASPRRWVGLDNYVALLGDERFRAAVGRTFVYTLLAVVLPTLIGIAAA